MKPEPTSGHHSHNMFRSALTNDHCNADRVSGSKRAPDDGLCSPDGYRPCEELQIGGEGVAAALLPHPVPACSQLEYLSSESACP